MSNKSQIIAETESGCLMKEKRNIILKNVKYKDKFGGLTQGRRYAVHNTMHFAIAESTKETLHHCSGSHSLTN